MTGSKALQKTLGTLQTTLAGSSVISFHGYELLGNQRWAIDAADKIFGTIDRIIEAAGEPLDTEYLEGFAWEVATEWSKLVYSVLPDSWNPWLDNDETPSLDDAE